jgi:hypothetical protein
MSAGSNENMYSADESEKNKGGNKKKKIAKAKGVRKN